jgi:hypothetical protein
LSVEVVRLQVGVGRGHLVHIYEKALRLETTGAIALSRE